MLRGGRVQEYVPKLAQVFAERGWCLPGKLDRVYDSSLAQRELGWSPKQGYESVFAMLDDESAEVLPVVAGR